MFSFKKSNDSQYLTDSPVPKLSGTYNGVPRMTSTPLQPLQHATIPRRSSVILSPKSTLATPRRYSLSDINSSMNKSNQGNKSHHMQGPLLASLNYKDNVSIYEETKSSGLAERIVLYNEQVEKAQPTHQEKYNAPGLFPIVHLFKKKPPPLDYSLKRVKIKLSNSDYLKHTPVHYKSKIADGIIKSRFQSPHNLSSYSQGSNDTETKSVLDALKEISRKRIHSNEDYDLNEESGKRIRTELHNGHSNTSKRIRNQSPLLNSPQDLSPKQTQKKICVYDEYAASKSSTDFSFLNKKIESPMSKRKSISTSTESLKESKQIKLINAETQTVPVTEESKIKTSEASTNEEVDSNAFRRIQSSAKVFSDMPLDKMRKNRLAALMGNLAGKDASICDFTISSNSENKNKIAEETKEPEENIRVLSNSKTEEVVITTVDNSETSIISPSKTNKSLSPNKSKKHVHFTLPSSNFISTTSQASLTQTSVSVLTPIVSATLTSKNTENSTNIVSPIIPPYSSAINVVSTNSSSFSASPSIKSITADGIHSSASASFSNTLLQTPKIDPIFKPTFSAEAPKSSSPAKVGGFKFDLKTSSSNSLMPNSSTLVNPSQVSLVSSPNINSPIISLPNSNSSISFPASGSEAKENTLFPKSNSTIAFAFGKPLENKGNETITSSTSTIKFPLISSSEGKKDATPLVSSTSNVGFSFGKPIESQNQNFTFGSTTTTTTSSSVIATTPFNFGLNKSPTFSFGSGSATAALKSTNSNPTANNSSGFNFGSPDNITKFGNTTTATSTATTFGTPTTSATFPAALPKSSTFVSKPQFHINTNNSPFGTNTTRSISTASTPSTFMFGGNTATTSANKPAYNFGARSSASTAPSIFGRPKEPSTTAAELSTKPALPVFNSGSGTSVFGNITTTAGSIFGSTPAVATSSVFGSNMSTNAPVFGGANSAFSSVPQVSPPSFGAFEEKQPFGTTNIFGTSTPNSKPVFGSTTVISSSTVPTFSNSIVPSFGSTTVTTTSVFSGNNSTPAFTFGAKLPQFVNSNDNKQASSIFGSGAGNSAFGKPTTTQTGFGNSTGFGSGGSGFGTSMGGFAGPTGGFGNTSNNTFGSQPAPQPNINFNFNSGAAPTSFMGSNPPKPTFNFTGGAPSSGFSGSSNAPAPAFGSSPQTFGATGSPAAGVFNIGSGTSTNRLRTQLRAKRRT